MNLNVFSREFGSRLNSRLNNSTIMITSNPTKSVVDMKLYEFSKNFGIYRERCGALTIIAKDADSVPRVMTALQTVIRSNYSMPPSHGARIVGTVFGHEALKEEWAEELEVMRKRIAETRIMLRTKMEKLQVLERLTSF